MKYNENISLESFTCVFGDRERTTDTIGNLASLKKQKGVEGTFAQLGCNQFYEMTRDITTYVQECIGQCLSRAKLKAQDVGALVLSTTDGTLPDLDQDSIKQILIPLGLNECRPALVSMQQCASSMAALNYANALLCDEAIENVLLCAFDFVKIEEDRVKSFALFGDAVSCCIVKRSASMEYRPIAYASGVDISGLDGKDDFVSRKQVSGKVINQILAEGNVLKPKIKRVFSTNLYLPIAMFNASITGFKSEQLYFETLSEVAHCGNCDWMINLCDYNSKTQPDPGDYFIAQATAPGFFAACLLQYKPS